MAEIIIGGVLLLTAVSILIFACSNRVKRREYTLMSGKISEEITLAHISDLHESTFGKRQCELIAEVAEIKPDLIFITGDIIEDDEASITEGKVINENNPARIILEALPQIAPCYMVFGNHESNLPNTDALCEMLESFGVHVLHANNPVTKGMSREVIIKNQRLFICGADDPVLDKSEHTRKKTLIERFTEDKNKQSPLIKAWRERLTDEYSKIADEERLTLLLSHRPEEYELYEKLGFDAAFSGHAHGGQWRLPPFINGVYAPHQGLFPSHAGGCYRYDGFAHIVSRGLSKKRMVRIFNRPEICEVKFVKK
ncbi:MAG: metallophosphoesterase [Clostridia bacterium]|nr:metallophosphoesterase [Clostridia bacterium]